ncbi:MAG: RedB protein [Acidobacteria bacterium]|nr:MAG: RedB protein [Acidobacteriota bacterium]
MLAQNSWGPPTRSSEERPARAPRTLLYPAVIVAWLASVLGGFVWLSAYKATPGPTAGESPSRWPVDSRIPRDPDRATLILFAHPHCPCTRASVSELARLMGRLPGRLSARVMFLRPSDVHEGWEHTDLWQTVSTIPGAAAFRDDDGVEAARFGAATSGFTVVYDAQGNLLFRGGLTASRGHEGDSFGQRRVVSLLTTGAADRSDSPVFGCALGSHPTVAP